MTNKTLRVPATFAGIMCAVLNESVINTPTWTNKHQKARMQHKLDGISDTIMLGMMAQKQNSDTLLINVEGRKELLTTFQRAFNKVHFPKGRDHDALMTKSPSYASVAAAIMGDNVVPIGAGGHRQHQGAGHNPSAKLRTGTGD